MAFDAMEKLKQLAKWGANDGTREAAEADLRVLENQKKIDQLLKNEAFQLLLESIKSDFIQRLESLVEDDPKLSAYKDVLNKLIGHDKAEEQIKRKLEQFVD